MDSLEDRFFPTTCLVEAIKYRPASLGFFYRLGCDPWDQGGMTLEMLGILSGLTTEQILRELEAMPVPGPDTPWEEQPVHFLIDFLTARHREFIYADLPAFQALLETPPGKSPGTVLARLMRESFHRFSITLRRHMREEEIRHFPAILRNEYALRHGGSGRIRPMSEGLLASDRLINSKDEIALALDQWMRFAEQGGRFSAGPVRTDIVSDATRELGRKIRAHERLEQERLYPMAARIELELAGITSDRE